MNKITVFISFILSVISVAIMSYISMATPIGPWIAPTLVLFATIFFNVLRSITKITYSYTDTIIYATVAGSVGGIAATAVGFSFPAIYFLDPTFFNSWIERPWHFIGMLSGLTFVASWLGFWLAERFEEQLLIKEKLSFPIGQLVHKMIAAQNQIRKAYELLTGFLGTIFFCVLQDGIAFGKYALRQFIPRTFTFFPGYALGSLSLPILRFDLWPLVWAIGFVTGHVIMVPLAVGALSKIFVLNPINSFFFVGISSSDFVLAFASGMVLISAVMGMIKTPKLLFHGLKNIKIKAAQGNVLLKSIKNYETMILATVLFLFLTYCGFPLLAQLYLIIGTGICTYQIALIAGKIGLAQLGRFATFVMVPAMFLFKLSLIQIIVIATFVEISGGVAVDVLFGRKTGYLSRLPKGMLRKYQFLGIIVSSLCMGFIVLLLIKRFGLGTEELFAQRAYARALLVQSGSVNMAVLGVGCVFGYILMRVRMSPMLVLSGLLMPLNITVGLITGGLMTNLTKDRESWYPFWSGVFAANSLWMLIKTFV